MDLGGQARSESGYAMAALIIAMSIMALMMTAVMPVWKQTAQREKEEELVFRGQQYVHAIALYGRKYANTAPPSIDVLVEQRFLRRKYKDPITSDDFQPVLANQAAPAAGAGSGAQVGTRGRGGSGPTLGAPQQTASTGRGTSPIGTPGAGPVGGLTGVASKSKEKSIRLYNGRNHYNEWVFVYQPQIQAPGAGAPGVGVPGRGGQPIDPFGRGGAGQRGRGQNPPGGRPGGPGFPNGPQRGPGGRDTNPFSPGVTPFSPQQPGPGRGRF